MITYRPTEKKNGEIYQEVIIDTCITNIGRSELKKKADVNQEKESNGFTILQISGGKAS